MARDSGNSARRYVERPQPCVRGSRESKPVTDTLWACVEQIPPRAKRRAKSAGGKRLTSARLRLNSALEKWGHAKTCSRLFSATDLKVRSERPPMKTLLGIFLALTLAAPVSAWADDGKQVKGKSTASDSESGGASKGEKHPCPHPCPGPCPKQSKDGTST